MNYQTLQEDSLKNIWGYKHNTQFRSSFELEAALYLAIFKRIAFASKTILCGDKQCLLIMMTMIFRGTTVIYTRFDYWTVAIVLSRQGPVTRIIID